jgi:hypothetical protein
MSPQFLACAAKAVAQLPATEQAAFFNMLDEALAQHYGRERADIQVGAIALEMVRGEVSAQGPSGLDLVEKLAHAATVVAYDEAA